MTTLGDRSESNSHRPTCLPAYARSLSRRAPILGGGIYIARRADAEACAIFRLSASSFQGIQLSVNCRRENYEYRGSYFTAGRIISRPANLSAGPPLIPPSDDGSRLRACDCRPGHFRSRSGTRARALSQPVADESVLDVLPTTRRLSLETPMIRRLPCLRGLLASAGPAGFGRTGPGSVTSLWKGAEFPTGSLGK